MSDQYELEKYFRTIQPANLLGRYEVTSFKNKQLADNAFVTQVGTLLVGSGRGKGSQGLPSLTDIVTNLNGFIAKSASDEEKSEFHDIIRVYCSGGKIQGSDSYWKGRKGNTIGWDAVMGEPQVDESGPKCPQLGVIQSSSPFVSMNVRDTNRISLFMNSIPTIELNRAVPFLDVKFQFKRTPNSDDKRLNVPSILKFLNGGVDPTKNFADNIMNAATIDQQIGIDGKTRDVFRAGMELFTAPHTLLNPSTVDNTAARYVPIIDPFRPFMSLESFEVTAAPTVGLFSYKTADLSIVLHDRSRLSEISDLVRPQVYGNTTLSISYGWKHPDDDSSDNAFGSLLNSMAIYNEKYGIVNCSFAFDQVGQVKIKLKLAMKGTQELRVVTIAEDAEYQSEQRALEELTKEIARLRQEANLARPEGFQKEVRAYQILDAAERGELVKDLSSQQVAAFIKTLRDKQGAKAGKNANDQAMAKAASELADKLKELFGNKPQQSMPEKLKSAMEGAINKKFQELEKGEDPFLETDENTATGKLIRKYFPNDKNKRVVSLAKVFLTFIGKPLQSIKSVNEVQFIYYQFNNCAGQLGNANIGSFPVEIEYLRRVFAKHVKAKNNPNLTINEFIMLLQGAVIHDPRAIGYGLREAYSPRTDEDKEPEVVKGANIENFLANAVQKQGGTFKFPMVEAYVETAGGRPFQEGQLLSERDSLDLMRIHVYDKAASPFEPMLQLVRSQSGLQEVLKSKQTGEKSSENINKLRTQSVALAQQAGLQLRQNPVSGKVTLLGSLQNMKDYITQVLPTITYGANNTAIANGTLQTMQNQLLSTVNMMRSAGPANNVEPNGSSVGGIPLRTIPAQLDLNIHGCPLLNINQQFFVDFQTGTTIDNIYLLTHLSHRIKPGQFETHAKFVPLDAYGVYESIISKVDQLADELAEAAKTSK